MRSVTSRPAIGVGFVGREVCPSSARGIETLPPVPHEHDALLGRERFVGALRAAVGKHMEHEAYG